MEVIIDGKRYVPAAQAAPLISDVLRALSEQWWGEGDGGNNYQHLRIIVSDDINPGEGESFDEFAARLVGILHK